ncbi:hypothetical protein H4582DRAFT_1950864 [Lactarius indigo]|nr:hypothetical protein H4582DRAFT_1950864 [Lactarius indigo]
MLRYLLGYLGLTLCTHMFIMTYSCQRESVASDRGPCCANGYCLSKSKGQRNIHYSKEPDAPTFLLFALFSIARDLLSWSIFSLSASFHYLVTCDLSIVPVRSIPDICSQWL